MEQPTRPLVAVTLLRHARRALLLLGGVFVWWLVVLAGGAAHADDAGSAGLTDQVVHEVGGHVARAVDAGAGVVSGSLRAAPSRVAHHTDALTGDAPAPVAPSLRSLTSTLEAGLSSTATDVADAVDSTTAQTHVVLKPVLGTASAPNSSRASQTGLAHTSHASSTSQPTAPTALAVSTEWHSSADPGDRQTGAGPDDGGMMQSLRAPTGPGLPGGSSSGAPGSAAALAGLVIALPGSRRLRRTRRRGRELGGPAYPPGSSPD